jgi:glycosyltransferase involved in cell wall biosynthesis
MLISIYLPTKNRRDLLSRAINSVLDQTHQDFELIIINDGSSDETYDYLDHLKARERRIRVVHHQLSLGAPKSRNEAIALSTGAFVTGLDDDDWFHPNRLKAFLEYWLLLEQCAETCSLLYSQDVVCTGRFRSQTNKPASATCEQLHFANHIGSTIFTRRQILLDVGAYDEDMPAWQDLDLSIRILRRFGSARLFDAGLYFFDNDSRPDRISTQPRENLMAVYRRLISKSDCVTPHMKQGLFMQLFGAYYGFSPSWKDLREFRKYRPNIRDYFHFFEKLMSRSSGQSSGRPRWP